MPSIHLTTTVATIAAKAQSRWQFLSPEQSVEFAWFSVGEAGDASEDDDDLVYHFEVWNDVCEHGIPAWMIR